MFVPRQMYAISMMMQGAWPKFPLRHRPPQATQHRKDIIEFSGTAAGVYMRPLLLLLLLS